MIDKEKRYSRKEHLDWCKQHNIPPVSDIDERYRNTREPSGRPLSVVILKQRKTWN